MKRREVLASAGVVSGALLAGCVTDNSPDDTVGTGENDSATDTRTGDDQGTAAGGRDDEKTGSDDGTESDNSDEETQNTEEETGSGDDEDVNGQRVAAESIVEVAVETTETGCGGGIEQSEWNRDGQTITVTGTFQAPTRCNKAVLVDISEQDGVVEMVVGREATSQECVNCVGSISYTATIEMADGATVEDVTVTHAE